MESDPKPPDPARRSKPRLAPPAFDAALIGTAPVHRRGFLGWFGAGGLAGAIAASLPAEAAKGVTALLFDGDPLMLDQVTQATFATFLGGVFQAEIAPGRMADATLIEVKPLGEGRPAGASARREPFSLLFRFPSNLALPQRIYALEHPKLGRLDIFLVPVRQEAEGLVLEAVFN